MSLLTQANTDSSTTPAPARPTEAGTVGIGVGVAVNKVEITNLATTSNATVGSVGLDVEATMRDTGEDPVQRYQSGKWVTIDSGESFPESPSDGDYFQLTKGAPATTTVETPTRPSGPRST